MFNTIERKKHYIGHITSDDVAFGMLDEKIMRISKLVKAVGLDKTANACVKYERDFFDTYPVIGCGCFYGLDVFIEYDPVIGCGCFYGVDVFIEYDSVMDEEEEY